jgi:hypothetical protein
MYEMMFIQYGGKMTELRGVEAISVVSPSPGIRVAGVLSRMRARDVRAHGKTG